MVLADPGSGVELGGAFLSRHTSEPGHSMAIPPMSRQPSGTMGARPMNASITGSRHTESWGSTSGQSPPLWGSVTEQQSQEVILLTQTHLLPLS